MWLMDRRQLLFGREQDAGRPIENADLWKEFLSTKSRAGVRIDICKVQNKSTPLLKRVDKLAKSAAKSHPRVDRGLVVGKIGRAKIIRNLGEAGTTLRF